MELASNRSYIDDISEQKYENDGDDIEDDFDDEVDKLVGKITSKIAALSMNKKKELESTNENYYLMRPIFQRALDNQPIQVTSDDMFGTKIGTSIVQVAIEEEKLSYKIWKLILQSALEAAPAQANGLLQTIANELSYLSSPRIKDIVTLTVGGRQMTKAANRRMIAMAAGTLIILTGRKCLDTVEISYVIHSFFCFLFFVFLRVKLLEMLVFFFSWILQVVKVP